MTAASLDVSLSGQSQAFLDCGPRSAYMTGFKGGVQFQPLWFDALGALLLATGILLLAAIFRANGDDHDVVVTATPIE